VKFLRDDPEVWESKYQGEIPVCSVGIPCGVGDMWNWMQGVDH
jgi:hypothetical protein